MVKQAIQREICRLREEIIEQMKETFNVDIAKGVWPPTGTLDNYMGS